MTLDDLIALCDEMAALARAGVPLDRGLKELARDLPGKLGRVSGQMARSLEQGQDLGTYLRTHEREFPPIFTAVVESGLRVGHLPAALEDLAQSGRRVAVYRRSILSAWVYPLVVVAVAFGLGLFMLARPVPLMIDTYKDVAKHDSRLLQWIGVLSERLNWWWVLPVAVVAYLAWSWFRAQHADLNGSAMRLWSFGLGSPLLRLRKLTQLAAFTHLLTLLVRHLVPLPEALRLAARGTGNLRLNREAERLAGQLERGDNSRTGLPSVPPVLSWLLSNPPPAGEMAAALNMLSDNYAVEVERQSDALAWYGPVVLTAGVGGTVAAVYCLLIAGPWISVLYAYIEQALS